MSEGETREKLLAAAKELFLARGYVGASVDMICDKANVSKGSFYHFFKNKEALGLAVLEWSLEKAGEILTTGAHNQVKDPVERSIAYLKHVEDCAHELWSGGCLLGTFANELAETHPRLQEAVAMMFTAVSQDLAGRLAPVAERLDNDPSAPEMADEFLVVLEGSVTMARAFRDPGRIRRGVRGFRESLESKMAQAVA